MFTRFDRMHERVRQTDRQTHTHRQRMTAKAALGASIARQKSLFKAVWCTKAVTSISRQGLETWKHQQSAGEKPQDGYNCPATRQLVNSFFINFANKAFI